MPGSKTDALIALARRKPVLRPRDLDRLGIPHNYLARLVRRGLLHKLERGLYSSTAAPLSESQSLIEVSQRVPKAVICLLSALRFHELTTQNPPEVWIAIEGKAWQPRISYPPMRVVRFSRNALAIGVQKFKIHGAVIRVFSPAKTVADCFKFRNKIGVDIAIEALRDCYRRKQATMEEIWAAARVCRVANVMRPYLESLS